MTFSRATTERGRHRPGTKGGFGVEVRLPHPTFRGVSASWHSPAEEAESDFDRQTEALRVGPGSACTASLSSWAASRTRWPSSETTSLRLLPNRL